MPGMTREQALAALPAKRASFTFWRLWAAGLGLFVVIAGLAAFYDYFPAALRVARAIQDVDTPGWGGGAAFTNQAGDPLWATLSLGAVVAGLAVMARWRDATYVLFALVPRGANALVKVIVDRPRPSGELLRVGEDAAG